MKRINPLFLVVALFLLLYLPAVANANFSQKVTLGDTSPSTPSLASLNGILYIAWNGTDSAHRLNVMTSTDNGLTFGNKFTSGETSPVAPSLAVHNGKLYITWRGTGNQKLNVAMVNRQGNKVVGFSQKVTLGDTSPGTPSLASLNGILYVAWNGTDSAHRLNVMTSIDNGLTFGNKYTSGETSPVSPSLVVHNNNLYVTWSGTGNQRLNVATVNRQGNKVTGFSQKITLGDTSPGGPSLASSSGILYIAWNGTDSAHRLNVMTSTDNGLTFGNKYTSGETSPVAPSLAVHNNSHYIAWSGTGNKKLNVAIVAAGSPTACGIPPYSPAFWNDAGTIQYNNNCYNYGNNKRTDTFAQPGKAAGAMYTQLTCASVYQAAVADGLDPLRSGNCANNMDKVALVVAPGWDYHWYRLDSGGMWSHKPGKTQATNVDNSGKPISNPETANRGPYTDFCGYFCSCSDTAQGQGHEHIK